MKMNMPLSLVVKQLVFTSESQLVDQIEVILEPPRKHIATSR